MLGTGVIMYVLGAKKDPKTSSKIKISNALCRLLLQVTCDTIDLSQSEGTYMTGHAAEQWTIATMDSVSVTHRRPVAVEYDVQLYGVNDG